MQEIYPLYLFIAAMCAVFIMVLKVFSMGTWNKKFRTEFPDNPFAVETGYINKVVRKIGYLTMTGGGGRIAFTDKGFRLTFLNPFMPKLLIPYDSFEIEKYNRYRGIKYLPLKLKHEENLDLIFCEKAFVLLERIYGCFTDRQVNDLPTSITIYSGK